MEEMNYSKTEEMQNWSELKSEGKDSRKKMINKLKNLYKLGREVEEEKQWLNY